MTRPRVAIVADLREERWHAMDLAAEMLLLNLQTREAPLVDATDVRPRLTRRVTRLPLIGRTARAEMADRILNRVWDYPRLLAPRVADFDLFHIIDHSYAHLATRLPPGRTIVTCHDVDALRGVLPGTRGQSLVQRALGRRLLTGLLAARTILCVTHATRSDLVSSGVIPADRLVVVPNGVHPACNARADRGGDREAEALLGPPREECVEILHVGSTVRRKRIDVLLRVAAALRAKHPRLRLIQVGGSLTSDQQRLASRLDLDGHVVVLPFLDRHALAAVYRRAAVLLQTSEREGFGLPVAEAMACGTPVVASDLPALREVGGPPTTYCPAGDVPQWTAAAAALIDERSGNRERWRARQRDGIAWARRFDWGAHARATVDVYRAALTNAAGRSR